MLCRSTLVLAAAPVGLACHLLLPAFVDASLSPFHKHYRHSHHHRHPNGGVNAAATRNNISQRLSFIQETRRGGSTTAMNTEDAAEENSNSLDVENGDGDYGMKDPSLRDREQVHDVGKHNDRATSSDMTDTIYVTKKDGRLEPLDENKVSTLQLTVISL